VITALKKDEDDDNLTLRFYEWAGKKTDVHLNLPVGLRLVSETNLMEVPEREATASVTVNPFEIKTVKLVRKK
jgi:alpha-mannosidase